MIRTELPLEESLDSALRNLFLRPVRTLFPAWSWKAAGFSALLRALTFFFTNRRAGTPEAVHAMLVEAVFAVFAAGLLGAVSQRLRFAKPFWATALFVWLAMPGIMLLAQLAVHRAAGTPHYRTGVIASFVFAAIASSFSWFAMRHGALLGGASSTTVLHDARVLPHIILNYILVVPRLLSRSLTRGPARPKRSL